MQAADFDKIVDERKKRISAVLQRKAEEYAIDGDRLHNFKAASQITGGGKTPEQALWGMAAKHLVSVGDMVDATGKQIYPTMARVDEKIGDLINYLILLEGLFSERAAVRPVRARQNRPAPLPAKIDGPNGALWESGDIQPPTIIYPQDEQ